MYYAISCLIQVVIIAPIFEWGFHYMLHKINNNVHKRHHIQFHKGFVSIEKWPIPLTIILYYYELYLFAFICLKYFIIHHFIHRNPNVFKKISDHHIIHHLNPEYNYGVTSIWPDKLFGTVFQFKKL